jgi:glycosyltransferase involved in cell wall biosynthesis
MITPLPPPDYGGIAVWARIVRATLGTSPDWELDFVDTKLRYRAILNMSWPARLVAGSVQAIQDTHRMRRRLRAGRPSLVHLCTSGGLASLKDILMLRLARNSGIPSVIHYHMGRLPSIVLRRGLEWRLTRRAMSLASAIATLDQRSENCVKAALPGQRVVRLPNMVELDAIDEISRRPLPEDPLPPNCPRIVFVGHLVPTKGLRELVESCARLAQAGCTFALDLVGPFPAAFRDELRSIVGRSPVAGWLRMHGGVEHQRAVQYVAAADLFVLPSYTEGAPNVILEAMASSRAILSTTVGAVPEMLDWQGPQECGVCVPPQDLESLLSALRALLADPQKRRELGQRARRRVEELYSAPVACQELVGLWKALAT